MSVFASLEESIEQRIVVRGFRHVDGFKKKYNIAEEIESKPFELNRRFNRGGIFHGTVTTQRSIADMKLKRLPSPALALRASATCLQFNRGRYRSSYCIRWRCAASLTCWATQRDTTARDLRRQKSSELDKVMAVGKPLPYHTG